VNEECRKTCECFSGIFKALRIEGVFRNKLASILSQLDLGDFVLAGAPAPDKGLTELLMGEAEGAEYYQMMSRFRKDSAPLWLGDELDKYEWAPPTHELCQTGRSFLRAHFYVELARALELYLSPHPERAEYIKRIAPHPLSLQESIVLEADEALQSPFLKVVVDIPPVAELVVRTSRKRRLDLAGAVLEVRESKNARRFRKWCAKMSAKLGEGRAGLAAAQRIERELKEVCSTWRADVEEGVRYKRRQLDLGVIPCLGKVLTFFGMQKLTIKDPIIRAEKPYLLFLNDLYRS